MKKWILVEIFFLIILGAQDRTASAATFPLRVDGGNWAVAALARLVVIARAESFYRPVGRQKRPQPRPSHHWIFFSIVLPFFSSLPPPTFLKAPYQRCLVQVGNGIELETVGFQFEPNLWLPCGATWDSCWTVAVIKLLRTSIYIYIYIYKTIFFSYLSYFCHKNTKLPRRNWLNRKTSNIKKTKQLIEKERKKEKEKAADERPLQHTGLQAKIQ